MTRSVLLAVLALVMFGPAGVWLDHARWPVRAPRAAIVLWQAIGVSGALAAVGAGLSLAVASLHRPLIPGVSALFSRAALEHHLPVDGLAEACGLTVAATVVAVLLSGLIMTTIRTVSVRRQHRILLDLVGVPADDLPGTVVLRDPRATAYCLPGVRPRIVISDGATDLLDHSELSAVVSHELGHVHGHHDLALLPFASLREMLSWVPYASRAPKSVGLLLEMAADDFAARRHDRRVLASALVAMADTAFVPLCAFGASTHLAERVRRLAAGPDNSAKVAVGSLIGATVILVSPMLLMATNVL